MRKIVLILGVILGVSYQIGDAFALEALKKTVAVFDFQNDSGWAGSQTLGQDFGTQLSDALVQSGKFIVLSRQDFALQRPPIHRHLDRPQRALPGSQRRIHGRASVGF